MTQPGEAPAAPVRVSRSFHVAKETLFAAWSTAEHVSAWFSPLTYDVAEPLVEMRVGGAFDVCLRAPSGEVHWTRGKVLEVVAPTRLVIEMRVTGPGDRPLFSAMTEVTFTQDLGRETRMDVVQTYGLTDPAVAAPMVAGAAEGWRTTLDKLGDHALRMSGAVSRAVGTPVRSATHATFQLEKTFAAPVERVWRALTDLEAKQQWFGGPPGEWEQLERHMDVREGGHEVARGRFKSGMVSTFRASYHDVAAPERLVYTYAMWLDEKKISVSLATMQLIREGGGTRLRVTEQGAFLDGYDDAGAREQGTGYLLEALGSSLKA